jgi:hypothetical protein
VATPPSLLPGSASTRQVTDGPTATSAPYAAQSETRSRTGPMPSFRFELFKGPSRPPRRLRSEAAVVLPDPLALKRGPMVIGSGLVLGRSRSAVRTEPPRPAHALRLEGFSALRAANSPDPPALRLHDHRVGERDPELGGRAGSQSARPEERRTAITFEPHSSQIVCSRASSTHRVCQPRSPTITSSKRQRLR